MESHQHYHFIVINRILPEFVWLPVNLRLPTPMGRWWYHGSAVIPRKPLPGLKGECCSENIVKCLAVSLRYYIFLLLFPQYICLSGLSPWMLPRFSPGLCNKTITAVTKQLFSESSVLYSAVCLLKWKFFILKWPVFIVGDGCICHIHPSLDKYSRNSFFCFCLFVLMGFWK